MKSGNAKSEQFRVPIEHGDPDFRQDDKGDGSQDMDICSVTGSVC